MLPVTAEELIAEDLGKSGLEASNMDAYLAGETELAAVGIKSHLYLGTPGVTTPGYVIPYYGPTGSRVPFYRVRLFKPLPKGDKYLQPRNSGTWIYFPKQFAANLAKLKEGKGPGKINGFKGAIILTEGEKKAARACREGYAACAVGGVYNWRTRTIILPEGTQLLKNNDNQIVARLEKGTRVTPTGDRKAILAGGFEDLIRICKQADLQIVLCFDSDMPVNLDVETAAAELGFEFRSHGLVTQNVRHLKLPVQDKKMGLDDFFQIHGPTKFQELMHQCLESKSAFPSHPNLKALINKRMSAPQIDRRESKELALMILTDMDRHGSRMIEKSTGIPYYFDSREKVLMPVNLLQHHSNPLHESKIGEFLYKQYDISQADMKLVQWLAAGFTGEDPVTQVEPRSVIALMDGNRIAQQLDDGHFCIVSGDPQMPFRIVENGQEGLLFKADQVEPIDHKRLKEEFTKQLKWLASKPKYDDIYWPKSLSQMKFNRDNDPKMVSVLSYLSPWLQRWNGAQLPVELMIGEPGSGKSSLYSLRLQILTGRPALRNQPTDVRDWYASITAQDGMHVVDNVHMVNKDLRQRLSDEICRIVTEPHPFIEMRKLFTTSDNFRLPVRTVFAMTAIQQPFVNADILQRSIIMEVQAIGNNHVSDWAAEALKAFGGREAWLAHHLAVLHLFFKKVGSGGGWNTNYKSGHRLAHFEQMFKLMGGIIGVPDAQLVSESLKGVAEQQVSEYDWTMEALKTYCQEILPHCQKDPKFAFTLQDISTWALSREEYQESAIVTNARRLSRYIKSHKYMVEKVTGLMEHPIRRANRDTYRATFTK